MHIPERFCGVLKMDEEKLVNAVLDRADESEGKKRLSCAEAFALAKEFAVETGVIGRICNQQNVRICRCQLGCFA